MTSLPLLPVMDTSTPQVLSCLAIPLLLRAQIAAYLSFLHAQPSHKLGGPSDAIAFLSGLKTSSLLLLCLFSHPPPIHSPFSIE
jgi:hypothetical protein